MERSSHWHGNGVIMATFFVPGMCLYSFFLWEYPFMRQPLKTPAKRSQHFNETYRNIVGRNMLRAFGHPVAKCYKVFRQVGCCWLKFENGQNFHGTFVDAAWCYGRLARFVQQCCTRVCALGRFSIPNISQHVALCQISLKKFSGTNLYFCQMKASMTVNVFSKNTTQRYYVKLITNQWN